MTAQAVVAAVLQTIRDALPGVDVYDAQVLATPPGRYVVLWPDLGTRSADTVEHRSSSTLFRWQTTCVAPDREMAAWLAETVQDALVDTRLSVDGWSPGLIEHTFGLPPSRDEAVLERPVVVAIDRYQLLADRLATQDEEES